MIIGNIYKNSVVSGGGKGSIIIPYESFHETLWPTPTKKAYYGDMIEVIVHKAVVINREFIYLSTIKIEDDLEASYEDIISVLSPHLIIDRLFSKPWE